MDGCSSPVQDRVLTFQLTTLRHNTNFYFHVWSCIICQKKLKLLSYWSTKAAIQHDLSALSRWTDWSRSNGPLTNNPNWLYPVVCSRYAKKTGGPWTVLGPSESSTSVWHGTTRAFGWNGDVRIHRILSSSITSVISLPVRFASLPVGDLWWES